MTLSLCSQCKNYSEEVCLLGQSYADVFSSIQTMADPQEGQRLSSSLASCAYWEESDLSKLFSRDVTLSYHAWSRLAYMKIQNGDRDLFQNLINVAREVVLQQRQILEFGVSLTAGDTLATQKSSAPMAEEEPPQSDVGVEEASQPLSSTLNLRGEAVAMGTVDEATPVPPQAEGLSSSVPPEATAAASGLPVPAPVKLPSAMPSFHPELVGQPGIPVANDPIELAMQELWVMATASSNGDHKGHHLEEGLDAGRGSGRLDPTAD
ncbi:hypothetical protein [Phormidium sp. FACHB-1136]|jgi:hypothetical protein|uniref:hypothetical protein n=1 Tax=Phormidium sp. FACHB-1136 TaxID=2692848 RepID=UPI001688C618|nr:hypothetical protein [Phormidium sp. FACHB-1136]MBD2428016.1 hypothetical protein [Phormidium sp. FACHB-1136]